MLRAANLFLAARSRGQLAATSLLLVAAIGAIDHLTGYELAFSIFYVVPVGIGIWYAGSRLGVQICLLSATIWLAVDYTSGNTYSNLAIPFWNAGVRLGFFLIIAQLLGRLRGALAAQTSLAQQDGLTGVMNARTFRQRYDLLASLAARHHRPIAIGYLDLDGFKDVNDRLGHGVGDQVLQSVATAMSTRLRASDVVARLGGDEFAVLLPETEQAGARTFFTALHGSLVALAAQNRWPVGFSIGVAIIHPAVTSAEDAIRRADDLMYRVKTSGKNRILIEEDVGAPSLA